MPLSGYIFGAVGRALTQATAGGATCVQGAALCESAGNGQRPFGAQTVRVHINLHFVRVNPGAGMLLLSAGGKFSVTEKLGIAEKLGAFFTQLLHGGCNGNGQRHGAQNSLRFCTGCGGLNFARNATRSTDRGVARSADRNIGSVQIVADYFAEGVRHWFSFRCTPFIRGGVGAHPHSRQMGEGLKRRSKLFSISASRQYLWAWFFSRSAWVVAK